MKKIFKSILTFAFAMMMALSVGENAYAYSYDSYEVTDSDFFLLKSYDKNTPSNVVLYLYTDTSDRNIKNIESAYTFKYVGGEGMIEGAPYLDLMYEFNPFNAEVHATLENGEVWLWQFSIENGDYVFANENGSQTKNSLPNIKTLSKDLEWLTIPADWQPEDGSIKEIRTVENETVRLYALYGNNNWKEAHVNEFVAWASENEASLYADKSNMEDSKLANEDSTEEVISIDMETPETSEITDSPETSEIPTVSDNDEAIETVPVIPPTEDVSEEETNNFGIFIKGAIAFVILGFVGFCLKKRK